VVSLVREKGAGKLYAMKQLRKTDMLRKGQEGHVRAERDVLKGAALVGNPNGAEWIVRLFYSFQDRDHLYLVRLNPLLSSACHLWAPILNADNRLDAGPRIYGRWRFIKLAHREGCL
jgi:hypothetical protein